MLRYKRDWRCCTSRRMSNLSVLYFDIALLFFVHVKIFCNKIFHLLKKNYTRIWDFLFALVKNKSSKVHENVSKMKNQKIIWEISTIMKENLDWIKRCQDQNLIKRLNIDKSLMLKLFTKFVISSSSFNNIFNCFSFIQSTSLHYAIWSIKSIHSLFFLNEIFFCYQRVWNRNVICNFNIFIFEWRVHKFKKVSCEFKSNH